MNLVAVREDVAVIDELLREIARRPVDMSNPNWMADLRRAPDPLDEAGVTVEAVTALEALLDAYESGGPEVRAEVREIFRAHSSFQWAAHLPTAWESVAEFRRRLVHVSAADQASDPRDELVTIWRLCNKARARGIDVEPVLREVAGMSSEVNHHGFGSMQRLIMRGLEEHNLD